MTDKAAREAFDPAEIEKLIAYMVNRFLGWKLPSNFSPDAGISFKPNYNEHTAHPMKHEPIGTNLFDAAQAEAMVRYMLAGSALCTGYQSAHDAAMAAEPDVGALVVRLHRMSDMSTTDNDLRDIPRAADALESLALQLQAAQQREAECRKDAEPFVRFAAKVMDAYSDGGWGGDIDGCSIQEWADEYGLLYRQDMKAPDAPDECENCEGDCGYCYRVTPALKVAIAALATQPTSKGETT